MTAQSIIRNEDQKCVFRSIDSQGLRILWEVTSACDLECDFCLVEKKFRQLPLERALGVAGELVDCGVDKFLISGGEPLLFHGIEELLEYLVGRKVLVKLLTNGTVHNQRVFDLINDHDSMEVSLSLPSIDEKIADEIFCKPGSFRRLLKTIECLPLSRLNAIAACGSYNLERIEQIIDWIAERGIPCVSITNIFQAPNSKARFRDDCCVYRIDEQRLDELFELIQRKRREYQGRVVIRTTQFRGSASETCGAGRSVLYLDATGCLLPCTLTDNRAYRE
jgi:MoaA/NifB/PqqE/SkfB family radical SAM enzyme